MIATWRAHIEYKGSFSGRFKNYREALTTKHLIYGFSSCSPIIISLETFCGNVNKMLDAVVGCSLHKTKSIELWGIPFFDIDLIIWKKCKTVCNRLISVFCCIKCKTKMGKTQTVMLLNDAISSLALCVNTVGWQEVTHTKSFCVHGGNLILIWYNATLPSRILVIHYDTMQLYRRVSWLYIMIQCNFTVAYLGYTLSLTLDSYMIQCKM